MNGRTVERAAGDIKAKSSAMLAGNQGFSATFGNLRLEVFDRSETIPGGAESSEGDRAHGAQPTLETHESAQQRAEQVSFRTFETVASPQGSLMSVSMPSIDTDTKTAGKARAPSTAQIRAMVKQIRGSLVGPITPQDMAQAEEHGRQSLTGRHAELTDAIFAQCRQRNEEHLSARSIRTFQACLEAGLAVRAEVGGVLDQGDERSRPDIRRLLLRDAITQAWCDDGEDATSLDVLERAIRPLVKTRPYIPNEIVDTALSTVFETLGGTAMGLDFLLKITSILSRSCSYVQDSVIAETGAALVESRGKQRWPKDRVAAVHQQFLTLELPSYYSDLICKSLGMPAPDRIVRSAATPQRF